MACLEMQGTKFSFSILSEGLDRYWIKTKIVVENEYVRYENIDQCFTREEIEEFLFSMHRLLAGAYAKEYSLSFEKAGMAVDLYAQTKDGKELSREERRKGECTMVLRMLLKASNKQKYLGGVYSFIFHKEQIQTFAMALQEEYNQAFENETPKGRYLFVGVSPKGYVGCNYWYLDKTKSVKAGDYVWVRMGRRNIEQVVYVDSVKYFEEENAPYSPQRVKQVLRKATKEEIERAILEWKKEQE